MNLSHHGHDEHMMHRAGPELTTMDHSMMDHGKHEAHGGGDMGKDMDMDMHMDMQMYFHTGCTATILFEEWKTDSVGGILGSMIGIFLMAMFYEGLKYYREYLFRKAHASVNFSCINSPGDGPKALPNSPVALRSRMISSSHTLQTVLHVFQVTLSYFLMLIFMTYNVWLCLAVVLGAGAGFFIFGWKKAIVVDITEHCH